MLLYKAIKYKACYALLKIVCMFFIWSFVENTSVVKSLLLEKEILYQKMSVLPQNVIPFSGECGGGDELKQNFVLRQMVQMELCFSLKQNSVLRRPQQNSLLHPLTRLCTEEEKHNAVMRKSAEY